MANIITGFRILFSAVLLFLPAFSPEFYVLYCLAGFTDMIDGTVARKTDTVSEFGSRLDTVADIVFVLVCLIKLLPELTIPVWLWICIGVILSIPLDTFSTQNPKLLGNQLSEMEQIFMERSGMDICSILGVAKSGG